MNAKQMKGMGLAQGGKVPKSKGVMVGILAKLKNPAAEQAKDNANPSAESHEEKEMKPDAGEETHMAAAEEIMSAIKSGDKQAFVQSMKNFVAACGMGEGKSEEKEEEGEGMAHGGYADGGPLSKKSC